MLKKANDAASISSMTLRAFCDAMIRVHDEAGNVIETHQVAISRRSDEHL
jgi:hypothetical protein